MRKILIFSLLLLLPAIVVGQSQTRERRSADKPSQDDSVRDRVVARANHVESQKATVDSKGSDPVQRQNTSSVWGNTAVTIQPAPSARPSTVQSQSKGGEVTAKSDQLQRSARQLIQPTSLITNSRTSISAPLPARPPVPATATYCVGIGDVLDVRLPNLQTRESTLFTVLKNGTLEYPLVGSPISVIGLTTDEVANLLSTHVRVIPGAKVSVSVRDYASHAVVITGAVDSPGRKILRREAMPLYAVLAEALPRPEATVATIARQGKEGDLLPLNNEQAMATMVKPGDVIRISSSSASQKFLYVGGEVGNPGEKIFRDGMTLTQALLSAGGASRPGKAVVKVARRDPKGFLSTSEYVFRLIEEGKSPDPVLQPGDRVSVSGS